MVEGRGGRSHVVNEIQEHTNGVSRVSRPGCSSTSFQSESHPVPRGPTDPPGSIIKRQGRNIINNREQTDNTAALRQRLKRSGQRSAISPLPHNRDQGPLNNSRRLSPRTQRTNRRRDRRRGWTRTLLARDELDGWSDPRLQRRTATFSSNWEEVEAVQVMEPSTSRSCHPQGRTARVRRTLADKRSCCIGCSLCELFALADEQNKHYWHTSAQHRHRRNQTSKMHKGVALNTDTSS